MIMEKVKCLKELEWKMKGKQLENRFYESFILGVFNIWGTVAFDLLLFCSLIFCSWKLKYLLLLLLCCFNVLSPLYICNICLSSYWSCIYASNKTTCFPLTLFHVKTLYMLAFLWGNHWKRCVFGCWPQFVIGQVRRLQNMTIGILCTYFLPSVLMKTHFIHKLPSVFDYRWRKSNHS